MEGFRSDRGDLRKLRKRLSEGVGDILYFYLYYPFVLSVEDVSKIMKSQAPLWDGIPLCYNAAKKEGGLAKNADFVQMPCQNLFLAFDSISMKLKLRLKSESRRKSTKNRNSKHESYPNRYSFLKEI